MNTPSSPIKASGLAETQATETEGSVTAGLVEDDSLVEEISIDGMRGVY